MSINLQKGQKIDLTKGGKQGEEGLTRLLVGLGWDEAQQSNRGGLFGIFGRKPQDIDCDASVILLNSKDKLYGGAAVIEKSCVYFDNTSVYGGTIRHMGDNLTGGSMGNGKSDSEQITVNLKGVPSDLAKMVFVVNIYDAAARGQHFGLIRNAYIRIVDSTTNTEICRYNLSENYDGMTGMIVGEIYRENRSWKFNAIGKPVKDASRLGNLVRLYA